MKKNGKTKTDPRMSFVYGCDSSETENSALGVNMLRQILDKVTWAMKACTRNPLGNLIWRYCEENEVAIVNYMMGEYNSQEASEEIMTKSVDAAFKDGYSLKFETHLNQFMVDYNIIRILKDEMGFRNWTDLSETEISYCYRNFTSKNNLPDWNIIEEKFK